ncbi:uncharacterized protein DS421_4g121560 [Arachis hypogaea]|nr:uncharacterized protein DS421_4g121560 [Arachis hypogaea]
MKKWLPGGCPALVEGRAGNGACGSLRACLVCVMLQDAALPLWRAGQCCQCAVFDSGRMKASQFLLDFIVLERYSFPLCHWGRVFAPFGPWHQIMLCPCCGQGSVAFQSLAHYVAVLEGSVPLWRAMFAFSFHAPHFSSLSHTS